MKKIAAALFDFDGVVADTEPLYTLFWSRIGQTYGLPADFPQRIKGTTFSYIFEHFLPDLDKAGCESIREACADYEEHMDYNPVPGVPAFISMLREQDIRVGLVTSSPASKMKIALKSLDMENVFDTLVTADRICCGKPHPEGYLLAARDLGVAARDCIVFEDSFNGIEAGRRAGMSVIGLSTTNPAEEIGPEVSAVIPDFTKAAEILPFIVK